MRLTILAVVVVFMSVSCAAHKGSSSFESAQASSASTAVTPKVKSNEQLKALAQAAKEEAQETKQKAQEQARQAAQKAQEQADAAKRLAEKVAQEEAAKVRASAQEAETAVQQKIDEAVDKTITVKEESAKVVESKSPQSDGNYHIIIGTFKSLTNARNVSSTAVANGFLPSIMENDEGLYRVSIYTGNEANVRKKLIEIRSKFPEYAGVWIMKLK